MSALVDKGLFEQARVLARAHSLSEDMVTLRQVEQRLGQFRNSCLWTLEKARLDVWQQCQDMFIVHHAGPTTAGEFFVRMADPLRNGGLTLTARERVMLLTTGLNWLTGMVTGSDSQCSVSQQQQLEMEIWLLKIKMEARGEAPLVRQLNSTFLPPSSPVLLSVDLGSASDVPGVRGWGTADCALPDIAPPFLPPTPGGEGAAGSPAGQLETMAEWQALDLIIGRLLTVGNIVQARNLALQFRYRNRDVLLVCCALQLAQEAMQPSQVPADIQELLQQDVTSLDTLPALRVFVSSCHRASECCRRIATNYEVAKALNMSYKGMLVKEAMKVLRFLLLRGDSVFELARNFIVLNQLKKMEVSRVLATLYIEQVLNPDPDSPAWSAWSEAGFSHFANLCDDPALLGRHLLSAVSDAAPEILNFLEKRASVLPIPVEVNLLCRAHSCFVLVCSMDGIDAVMTRARERVNHFAAEHNYEALVRLLTGIKKFREMEYVLDLLIEQDQFELLLSKRLMVHDTEGALELKMALRDYLIRHRRPEDADRLEMVSLHFSMHREIGENRLDAARAYMRRLGKQPPGTARTKDLDLIIQMLREAATNFGKEQCPRQMRQCLTLAHLVGLQVQLADRALLNMSSGGVAQFMLEHPVLAETLIVAAAFDKLALGEWIMPLYNQAVVQGHTQYLHDFLNYFVAPTSLYHDLLAMFQRDPQRQAHAAAFEQALDTCPDLFARHAVAQQAGLQHYADHLVLEHPMLNRTSAADATEKKKKKRTTAAGQQRGTPTAADT